MDTCLIEKYSAAGPALYELSDGAAFSRRHRRRRLSRLAAANCRRAAPYRSISTSRSANCSAGSAAATPRRRGATRRSRPICARCRRRSRSSAQRCPPGCDRAAHPLGRRVADDPFSGRHLGSRRVAAQRLRCRRGGRVLGGDRPARRCRTSRSEALVAAGMTRASIGIQDFNPKVQQAINREQSFAVTKAVVDSLPHGRRRFDQCRPALRSAAPEHAAAGQDAGRTCSSSGTRPHRALRLRACAVDEASPGADRRGGAAGCRGALPRLAARRAIS